MDRIEFLIIDDSPIDQLLAEKMLRKIRSDAVTHVMRLARPALDWISNRNLDVKLFILLDLQMPDMTGLEFVHRLSMLNKQYTSKMTIAMVSSAFIPLEVEELKRTGLVSHFINKPLSVAKLQEILP